MNNVQTPGDYQIANADSPAHCPTAAGLNAYIFVRRFWYQSRTIQIMVEANTNDMFFRCGHIFDGWTAWCKVKIEVLS